MRSRETSRARRAPLPERYFSRSESPGVVRTSVMSQPLQVLVVEDSENDALLLELELQRAGYSPACHRVETAAGLNDALNGQPWDLVIADYVMPRFNGLEALSLVKARGLDVPFIIVSGHIADDTAVAAMKAGAHDYVMKDNLARLGPAVQRELREAAVRREQRRADERLRVEQVFRRAIEDSVPSGIAAVDLEGRQTYVNPAFCELVGCTEAELVGARPPFVYWPPEEIDRITGALGRITGESVAADTVELRFCRRNGELVDVLLQITPLKDRFGNVTGWVSSASDITRRKKTEGRMAAEHAITRALAATGSLSQSGPAIVQALVEHLDVDLATLWVASTGEQWLRPVALHARTDSPPLLALTEATRRLSLSPGVDLPGQVWAQRGVARIADLKQDTSFKRRVVAAAAGLQSAMAFPIQSGSHFLGVFEFLSRRRLEDEPGLTNTMAAIGGEIVQFIHRHGAEEALRLAHAELEMRVQERTVQLQSANARLQTAMAERRRLETELLEITEKERRRIGLDLHDDLGQRLSGIALMSKGLELKLARKKAEEEAQDAARIHGLVQEAMSHTSDLAHELATLDVAKKDLPAALQELAAHASELFHIACRFTPEGKLPALDDSIVTQLYKIAQEAVTNAIKHGKAKRVGITLANGADRLVLTVQNGGMPFPDLRSPSGGMGLRIMKYRANLIGGALEIKALGNRGTVVTCSVPI
jgi:PAS domain S-box-containing protein